MLEAQIRTLAVSGAVNRVLRAVGDAESAEVSSVSGMYQQMKQGISAMLQHTADIKEAGGCKKGLKKKRRQKQ